MKLLTHHLKSLILVTLGLSSSCHMLFSAERVALVIGNDAYVHGAPLSNCVNDARAMAQSLRNVGFEVTLAENLTLEQMQQKVLAFKKSAQGAKAAWFNYAGHGAEVKGVNYLVPVDAKVQDEFQVKHRAFCLDEVLGALDEAATPLKVVVLDCCRDNPFGRSWSRSSGKGLTQVADTPKGTIMAFATSPGKVASDGVERNSPFTSALTAALAKPGLDIDQIFKETGRAVILATADAQRPWINSSFYDPFVLRPGSAQVTGGTSPPDVMPPAALPGPSTASKSSPFENSLEMKFVPINITTGGKDVLFSMWETRRQDYEAYAKANSGVDDEWENAEYDGEKVGHEPDHPVVCVSHDDAVAFCQWLTKKERASGKIGPNDEYRLPTDAEWSYAVGLGKKEDASASPKDKNMQINKEYPWGSGVSYEDLRKVPSDAGNYDSYSSSKISDDRYDRTSPVGSFSANPFGIYDLGGNVYEWCGSYYDGSSGAHVLRGGSWFNFSPVLLVSSYRYSYASGRLLNDVGFRCVLVVSAR